VPVPLLRTNGFAARITQEKCSSSRLLGAPVREETKNPDWFGLISIFDLSHFHLKIIADY
jgi:hypothetical protein